MLLPAPEAGGKIPQRFLYVVIDRFFHQAHIATG
jgi:hypothetical protein